MGDPKKLRKKYATPRHPWVKHNIDEEKKLMQEYALRNKKELLKVNTFLKKYKDIAKRLIAIKNVQGEKEKNQVLTKLQKLDLLPVGAELDQILSLELKNVLERRLQSVLFRKKMARSMNQARQFICHRHITLGEKEITSPSYLLSLEEEASLTFKNSSPLNSEEHPERGFEKEQIKEELEEIKKPAKKKVVVEDKVEDKKETTTEESKKREVKEEQPQQPEEGESKTEEKPAQKEESVEAVVKEEETEKQENTDTNPEVAEKSEVPTEKDKGREQK